MLGQPRCPLGKHPQPFFFFSSSDGHCGRWRWLGGGVGLQLYAPRALPSLITEDNTESRKKGAKRRDKRYPRRRIRFNFASFLLPAMFHFLPHLCNCSPHTSGSWHGMPRPGPTGRGRCAGDVPFCFLICMGVSAEWQISGETHASSPQKVAASRERRDAGDFSCQWRRREKFIQRVVLCPAEGTVKGRRLYSRYPLEKSTFSLCSNTEC